MAISLESIYKPVNDFFFNKFKGDDNAPIEFRMQQYGSVFSEDDFIELNDPDEEFSDFVNKIPVTADNGINLNFSMNSIDDTYAQILNALPYVTEGCSEDEKEFIEDNFLKERNKAIKSWEAAQKVRSGGIADWFVFSDSSPAKWYKNDSKNWQTREFEIKEADNTPVKTKGKANYQILKLRLSDEQLVKALPVLQEKKAVKAIDLSKQVLKAAPNPILQTVGFKNSVFLAKPILMNVAIDKKEKAPEVKRWGSFTDRRRFLTDVKKVQITKPVAKEMQAPEVKKTVMGLRFSEAFKGLKFNQKVFVKDFIKEQSPAKPIQTNSVNISFEYCVVEIKRHWFNKTLCNLITSWYIPGLKKGSLNNPDIGGLSYLPIAFVAVRKLKITANWAGADKESLEQATSFGPFDVKSNIEEKGSLTQEGIQVIGWMLQRLPDLPPNGRDLN